MRNLRSLALTSVLCLGFASGTTLLLAQDAGSDQNPQAMQHGGLHGPMSPDRELAGLTKRLQLSSDQQNQIKPILQDRHDQLMQLHQDQSLSRPDRMAKMKTLDEDSNTKLEAVLNPDQKTKYEKMIAERKEHMQEQRAEHNGSQSGAGDAQPQ